MKQAQAGRFAQARQSSQQAASQMREAGRALQEQAAADARKPLSDDSQKVSPAQANQLQKQAEQLADALQEQSEQLS